MPGWSVLPAMRVLHRVQSRLGRQARRAAAARPPGRLTPTTTPRTGGAMTEEPQLASAARRRAGQAAPGEHVHGGHPAVQAGVPAAAAARGAAAQPGGRRVRGRGVHDAVHPGAGGREHARPLPQRQHPAVGGVRGVPARARAGGGQPRRRQRRLGRGHADDPGLEARRGRRSSPTAGCATGTCWRSCRSRPTRRGDDHDPGGAGTTWRTCRCRSAAPGWRSTRATCWSATGTGCW